MKLLKFAFWLALALALNVGAQFNPTTLSTGAAPRPFARLGTVPDGRWAWCNDCIPGEPVCAAGGSGSVALRIGGVWNCSAGTSTLDAGDGVVLAALVGGVTRVELDDSIVPFIESGPGSPPGSCIGVGFWWNTSASTLHKCEGGVYAAVAAAAGVHTHESNPQGGQLNASNVFSSGVVPIARLATGTPTGSKFIRDDGVLAVPSSGGGGNLYLASYCGGGLNGSTGYCGLSGMGFGGTEPNGRAIAQKAGTFKNLRVINSGYNNAQQVITLQVNGVDTTITATLAGGSNIGTIVTDLVHTAAVAVGDVYTFKVVAASGATSPGISCYLEIE